jgi:hypothetical protein
LWGYGCVQADRQAGRQADRQATHPLLCLASEASYMHSSAVVDWAVVNLAWQLKCTVGDVAWPVQQ